VADGHAAPPGGVGSVAFDAADRLAIINLFAAYAYTYDENRLDEFRELFTEAPRLGLLHDGTELSQDIDTVISLLAARKAKFKAENNQRRHALNSFWFSSQSANEFTAVKHDGAWRLSRWVIAMDQVQLGG
jgi:hypothetical protein